MTIRQSIRSAVTAACLLSLWLVRPALPDEPRQLGLFALDLETKQARQVAQEPLPGYRYFGSPDWCPDGKSFAFDVTPGNDWARTHICLSQWPLEDGKTPQDLGPGNCPSFSPDGRRIVFLLNRGVNPQDQPGLWIMQADGSQRTRLAGGSIPKWSPGGKHILNISFGNPRQLSLIDVEDGTTAPVSLAGHTLHTVPTWVDANTLIGIVRAEGTGPTTIAIIDISNPAQATVKDTIWTRGTGINAGPEFPVYSPKMNRCLFAGRAPQGLFLLEKQAGLPGLPTFVESGRIDQRLQSLALSPDGNTLLFCSDREPAQARVPD